MNDVIPIDVSVINQFNRQMNTVVSLSPQFENARRNQARYEPEEDILSDVKFNAWRKYENVMILFPKVYNAWKIGQLDNDRAIRFFRSALVDIEDCLVENPDSANLQEQKTDIEKYLTKIARALDLQNIAVKSETKNENSSDIPGIQAVYNEYPEFKRDFLILLEHRYIIENNGELIWNKTKQALAEYIGHLPQKSKNIKWSIFENLFDITKGELKHFYSQVKNGNILSSKDYKDWLKIKKEKKV